jgi:hypothetical protein
VATCEPSVTEHNWVAEDKNWQQIFGHCYAHSSGLVPCHWKKSLFVTWYAAEVIINLRTLQNDRKIGEKCAYSNIHCSHKKNSYCQADKSKQLNKNTETLWTVKLKNAL